MRPAASCQLLLFRACRPGEPVDTHTQRAPLSPAPALSPESESSQAYSRDAELDPQDFRTVDRRRPLPRNPPAPPLIWLTTYHNTTVPITLNSRSTSLVGKRLMSSATPHYPPGDARAESPRRSRCRWSCQIDCTSAHAFDLMRQALLPQPRGARYLLNLQSHKRPLPSRTSSLSKQPGYGVERCRHRHFIISRARASSSRLA